MGLALIVSLTAQAVLGRQADRSHQTRFTTGLVLVPALKEMVCAICMDQGY